MSLDFDFSHDEAGVVLTLKAEPNGRLARLLRRPAQRDLEHLPPDERDLLLAIGDLRALGDEMPGALHIDSREIFMSHRLAALLDGKMGRTLGMPPLVDLTLRTDVEGVIGSPSFRLRYEWHHQGRRQPVDRQGCILRTSNGERRLPLWLLDAVEVADSFSRDSGDTEHWEALAKFRRALEPGVTMRDATPEAKVSMTDFLSGLEVRLADRFSITPTTGGDDFEVVPFSARTMNEAGFSGDAVGVPEASGELSGDALRIFQARVRERGALPAFRLAPGSFLVIDRAAAPVLDTLARVQKEPATERQAFIRNPRVRITEAVEAHLRATGHLDGLSSDAAEEAIEAAAGPAFVETQEFSERVVGISVFERTNEPISTGGTPWFPEDFARKLASELEQLSTPELTNLRGQLAKAIEAGVQTIPLADMALPARPEALSLIDGVLGSREPPQNGDDDDEPSSSGPIVLDTLENFDELRWQAKLKPRHAAVTDALPATIQTALKGHQIASFEWQVAAWKSGLPGILNADEQGL